jgi:hypothetical protein
MIVFYCLRGWCKKKDRRREKKNHQHQTVVNDGTRAAISGRGCQDISNTTRV